MNNVLGGLFASRINMNLREEHGYTYGAASGFFFNRTGGPFYAGALVRTDVTAPAAKQLMLELNRIPHPTHPQPPSSSWQKTPCSTPSQEASKPLAPPSGVCRTSSSTTFPSTTGPNFPADLKP